MAQMPNTFRSRLVALFQPSTVKSTCPVCSRHVRVVSNRAGGPLAGDPIPRPKRELVHACREQNATEHTEDEIAAVEVDSPWTR